jgi:hypothetical protein
MPLHHRPDVAAAVPVRKLVHDLDSLPDRRTLLRAGEQSRSLHRRIRAHGGSSTLVVTPLLSHGDLRLGPALLMGALPVLRAFARFFQLVEDGARAHALPRTPERVSA